ncbi:MAG: DUF2752 domain-containing protein [Phycisphaerales bacterium]|nr:DUF2752 domain-containing protein [Phycisphaerales bacterium]
MSAVPGGDSLSAAPRGAFASGVASRLIGLALAVVCAFPLVVGALITPSETGMGTHRALGLPPCGFLMVTGRPCMTCGMTTSVTLAAHGRLMDSVRVQPAGAVLSVVLASGLCAGLHALATGMTLAPLLEAATRRRTVIIGVVILVGAWGYKVWLESGSPSLVRAPAWTTPGGTPMEPAR